jgi:hypothetical protein
MKANGESKWRCVDAAKHANVYTDKLAIPGGHLYLITKMVDPKKPSRGATVHACVFVPSKPRRK